MNIGFDAKRIFHNRTGLGNYGRTLVNCLCDQFPENKYFLYNPKKGIEYEISYTNSIEILPTSMLAKLFPSLWRSNLMSADIQKRVDIFHGLSNELPIGLEDKKVKKIVTIHDLIFEIYPDQYKAFDRIMYHQKFKYACQQADKIIATSQITKQDIIHFYKIEEEKIEVIYQTCDNKFKNEANLAIQNEVRTRYNLPQQYLLSVGSIVERKNLLNTCNAFSQIQNSEIPLVIVGNGDQYKEEVKQFCEAKKITSRVIWLEEIHDKKAIQKDLPVIYQLASVFLYPSLYEGFGIPVLEAMYSDCPVITSKNSSMEEIGKDAFLYVNPNSVEEIKKQIDVILSNPELITDLISKGNLRKENFNSTILTKQVMHIYQSILNEN